MERRITHSCGHEDTHDVYGYYAADCDRMEIRLSRQKCASCRVASKRAKTEESAKLIEGLNLAVLDGSPKQIAWAQTIRLGQLAKLQCAGKLKLDQLACVTDAKWWIDRRGSDGDMLLMESTNFVHVVIDAQSGSAPPTS